jgi:hypothetical protein
MAKHIGRAVPANIGRLSSGLSPSADVPLAFPGQGAASSRTVGSGVRVVHGGFDTRDLKEAKALLEALA